MVTRKPYFEPVNLKVNFPLLEEEVLSFWKKNKIFEKSITQNKSKKNFVFYEGPPTANGKPGIHHVESRSFKDIIPRYKTMQGFYCERKAGWDCHGLPVELEVEKKLGISGKPQIEEFGIKEFNELCRKSVFEYVEEWSRLTERIGYWVDLENAYETLDNSYIESEWWILKQIWEKGWLYEDYKVLPYCPRCGTSLSTHELALGYKDDVEDPSVYIKFKVKSKENTFLLAWTTTPWTLPGNLALAIDPKETYIEIQTKEGNLILAQKRIKSLGLKGKILKKYKGKELEGMEYEPLYSFISYDKKAHYVIPADFVSMEDGTGIVHTAVMYGEDDFLLGKKFDLPQKHAVNEKGEFVSEVTPWSGMFVKKADPLIIEELESRGLMFKNEKIKHTYPFCWRCGTPLLYYAMLSWYLKTTAVKKELLENNDSVNWYPAHIKNGRMGEWLRGNHDWALSRSRYWGTPLPIWKCGSCGDKTIVGSIDELSQVTGKDMSKLDLHRPFIDEIVIKCSKCNGEMRRVNFVLDCWFDSGAMPFAQWHYPFENKEKLKDNFPADYISEAIDQTRGWFYTLQGVSALLEKGTAYKNVICLGHVLDEKGNKMSKSKGNVVDPWEVMNDVGADATRWYFYSATTPGPSFRFSSGLVKDVVKRFMLILWNSYNYFVTYANNADWQPKGKVENTMLDNWILAKQQKTVNEVTRLMDSYDLYNSTQLIENFISKDFSQWYIRRSRGRDDNAFFTTSHEILVVISQLIAPFTPFISESLYKNLTKKESVHLSNWPKFAELNKEQNSLLKEMELVRTSAEKIHAQRKEFNIPVRQPLGLVTLPKNMSINTLELLNILKDEVNIKDIKWVGSKIKLDTKITPELEEEGKTRELVRKIQDERKKMGTKYNQEVNVTSDWIPQSNNNVQYLKKKALINELKTGSFKVTPL